MRAQRYRLGRRSRPLVALVAVTAWAATLLVYGPPASAAPATTIPIVGPSQSVSNDSTPTWTFQLPADSTTTQPGTPDSSSPSYTAAATATATIAVTHRGSCFVGTGAPGAYTSCTTPTGTADEYSYTPTLTADGVYTFHVKDVETTTTTTTSYYADGTTSVSTPPPSVATGTDVAFGTTYTLDTSVGMSWTTEPASPGTSLAPIWTFDPGAAPTTTCAITPTIAGFDGTCTSPVNPTLPADGSYTLTVTGTDALGNTQTLTSTYQTVPPGAPGVTVVTPGKSTAVDWTLAPPAGATAMSAVLTSPTGTSSAPIALVGSATTVHTDLPTATEGDWVLSVTATVSGRTTAAGSATYTLDTTKPVLTVGSTNAATPTQPSWTVGIDDPAIAQCAVTGTIAGGAAYSSGTAACGTTYTSAVLAQGSYTLTVTATDAAGNAAVPVTRDYTYDVTPPAAPTVTSSVTSSLAVPSNNQAPVWTISGEAGGTFTCSWTSNNLAPLPASGPCVSGYHPTLPSTDDTYTLSVTQTDASGNTGPATQSAYYYDGSAPVTTFTAQPTSPGKDTTVSWTTSVNETSAKTECRLVRRTVSGDQVVYDWRTASNCGRTVTETLTAGDGTYLLQVRDTDAAGNVLVNGTTATGYVLDTTGPGAPTVAGTQGFGQSPNVSWTITPSTGDTTAYSCRLVKDNVPNAWASCTSPFTADLTSSGNGTYRLDVVASDALGNNSTPVTSSADYVYDTTPPAAPAFTGSNSSGNTPSQTWTWTQGETAPAVTATCQLYTWDGTTRTPVGTGGACTSPHTELLDPTAGTTYLLAVTLTDQAGNHSAADGPTYLLDTVAPTAPSVTGPTGTDNVRPATYTFNLGETGGTVQCQLMQRPTNSTTWSVVQTSGACVSPWNVTLPAVDGDYTAQVTQTDSVGNTSAYGESQTYTLDLTGPAAPAFTSGPTGTANAKDVTWTWTSEAASTATCSVTHDGTVIVAPEACNAGTYSTHLGDGDGVYTVTVQLTDQYGNVGGSTTSTPYTLDATAPAAPTVSGPSGTSNDTTADYAIVEPVESGATAECRLTRDGTTTVSDWASCTLPRTITLGVDGSYVLEVRLTDQYGNVGAPGASPAYLLDTAAPVVTLLPATQATQTGPAGWTATVTGGPAATCLLTSPVLVTADGYDTASPCSGFASITLPRKGTYTLTATSTDAAGNTGTATATAIYRDAPTVTVTPNKPTGNTTAVTWTVTATAGTTLACTLAGPGDPVHAVPCSTGPNATTVSSTEGTSTFTATATDPQTGFTGTASNTYVYDVTPPAAFTVTGTSGDKNTTAVDWAWTATDTTSSCQLRKNGAASGGPVSPCLTDWTTAVSGEGTWQLDVTLTDAAGNSTTASSPQVRVDLTAPVAPGVSTPTTLSNDLAPVWTLTGEAGATYTCSWTDDNGATPPMSGTCATGYAPTLPATDGVYTLHVVQTDVAGNTGPEQTVAYTLDLTAPVVTFTSEPTSPGNSTTVSWTTSVSETSAKTECRLIKRTSGADLVVYDWRTLSCGRTVTATLVDGDGTYELQVRDTDPAGNVDPAGTASAPYALDTTGPGTPTVDGPAGWNNNPNVTWTITAPAGEVPAGYTCRLVKNGTPTPNSWVRCDSQVFTTTLSVEATYRLDVESLDALGNLSTPITSSADYLFDPNPPAAAVFTGSASTGNVTTHDWTWSEGEPNLTADCRLFTVAGGTRTLVSTTHGCTSTDTETLAASTPGTTYVLEVTLTDRAGNSTAADGPSYLLDTVAPVAPSVSGPSGTNSVRAASYAFVPSEPGAVAVCNLMQRPTNSTTWTSVQTSGSCVSPWNVTLPAVDGDYATRVTLTDAAGNTSAYGESQTYTLDLTGPVAPTFTGGPTGTANAKPVTWTWTYEPLSTGACTLTHAGTVLVAGVACNSGTYSTTLSDGDGAYTLTVRLTDQYGNVGGTTTSATYTLDATPPGAPVVSGPSTTSNVTTASYAIVGPVEPGATAECRLERDSAVVSDWASCTLPTTRSLSGDGSYVMKVRLTDQYGNLGAPGASPAYLLDTTLPTVPAVTPPTSPSHNPSPVFTFVIDGDTTASCQLTRGSTIVAAAPSCAGSFTGSLSGLADGDYVLTVASRDAAGNVSTGTSAPYTYDTTAPAAPVVTGPAGPSQTRNPAFGFTSEVGARAECATQIKDGGAGPWTPCQSPYAPTLGSDGTWTLLVRLTDAADNVSAVGASGGYVLDTTAPNPPSVSAPASPGRDLAPSWSAETEAGSRTECRFTGPGQPDAPFTACSMPMSTPVSVDGTYVLEVRAIDQAGNVSPAGSGTYVLDTTAPPAPVVSQPTAPGRGRTPSMTYTAEAGTTASCRVTRGTLVVTETAPCTSPVQLNLTDLPDGAYTLTVRAIDAAGNTGPAATGTYVLDTTAPASPTFTLVAGSPSSDRSPVFAFNAESGAVLGCRLTTPGGLVKDVPCTNGSVTLDLSNSAEGDYSLAVTARDAAGNTSAPASADFTLDNTAPAAPRVTAGQGTPGSTRTPSWKVSSASPAQCRVLRGTATFKDWGPCVNNPTGDYALDLYGQPDAVYLLEARVSGTTAATSSRYRLDTTGPGAATITSPPSPSTGRRPTWTIASSEPAVTAECQVTVFGAVLQDWARCEVSVAGSLFSYDLAGLGDGTYTLSVRLTDNAGNVSPSSAIATSDYVLDTSAPAAVGVDAPATPGKSPLPTWTLKSSSGAKLECRLSSKMVVLKDFSTCTGTFTYNLAGQPDGFYTLTVHALSAAGTPGPETTSTYELDTTPPPMPGSLATTEKKTSNNHSPRWTFTLSPDTASVICEVSLNGSLISSVPCNTSPYTMDLTSALDGSYLLRVTAYDKAGNKSPAATASYTLRTQPAPTPEFVLEPGSPSSTLTPTWAWSTAFDVTSQCRIWYDGAVQNNGTWESPCPNPRSVILTGQPDGTYKLQVRVVDIAGNPSKAIESSYELNRTAGPLAEFQSRPDSPGNTTTPTWVIAPPAAGTSTTPALERATALSGTECQLTVTPDGFSAPTRVGPWEACSGPYGITTTGDGRYAVGIRAVDGTGTVGPTSKSTYRLDTKRPPPPDITGPPAAGNEDSVTWSWPDDATVRVDCHLLRNGVATGPLLPCPSSNTIEVGKQGQATYTLEAVLYDQAGNASEPASTSYRYDTTPPPAPVFTSRSSARGSATTATWTFAVPTDATALCVLSHDGNVTDQRTCDGTYTTPRLGMTGLWQLAVHFVDEAGNAGPLTVGSYTLTTYVPSTDRGGDGSSTGSGPSTPPNGGGDFTPSGPTPAGSDSFLGPLADHPRLNAVLHPVETVKKAIEKVAKGAENSVGLQAGIRVPDAIKNVIGSTITKPQLPLALFVIVVLFLLVQNRIDRRDPKLAAAPVAAEPELEFGPRVRFGATGGATA